MLSGRWHTVDSSKSSSTLSVWEREPCYLALTSTPGEPWPGRPMILIKRYKSTEKSNILCYYFSRKTQQMWRRLQITVRWWWPPISTSLCFGISYLKKQNVGRRTDEMSKKCYVKTKYSKENEKSYMVLQWQNTSNINERGREETFNMPQRCSHEQMQCLSVTPPITVNSQRMSKFKKEALQPLYPIQFDIT